MSPTPKVLVVTPPEQPDWPGLDKVRAQAEVRIADTETALQQQLPWAEILLLTDFRSELLARHWALAKRLQWIHATSAGVDVLMFPALVDSDIPVTNAQGVFDPYIAEYVLGCVLMFAKGFPDNWRNQQRRCWRYRESEPVAGKRMLVVGAGSIGRHIARLARAAGLQVRGIARRSRADPDFEQVAGADRLHELLPWADYVVVAAPLTEQTRGLFDREAFRRMRRNARFINVGRGPIVQTEALVEALRRGEIAGAALDVFEQEPLPPEHPLWDMEQVMISAHQAGDVQHWREIVIDQFLACLARWQRGEPLTNRVDKTLGYVPQRESEA